MALYLDIADGYLQAHDKGKVLASLDIRSDVYDPEEFDAFCRLLYTYLPEDDDCEFELQCASAIDFPEENGAHEGWTFGDFFELVEDRITSDDLMPEGAMVCDIPRG